MDRQKLEQELERLHKQSFGWALRCCREDHESAVEVLQNTYLKILEGKARFQRLSGLRTWLFSVIRLTAIDHFRAGKRNRPAPLEEQQGLLQIPDPGPDRPEAEEAAQRQLFQKGLSRLSPQQRNMLHLVFYQNCTIQEAADVMDMQLGTARTHYQRGKQQLKKWLMNAGFTEDVF